MKNKIGTAFICLGIVLLTAALSLFLYNQDEAYKADEASKEILSQMHFDGTPDPYNHNMTVAEIDGNGYIGYLHISRLDINVPVMSEWNYESLKTAPCRYYGSTKTNDLVIAAHNYFCNFGKISKLKPGDKVSFTDMDGTVTDYRVDAIDILSPAAVEEMTNGEYDLTLFTCTYGAQSRVTVRCVKA